MDTLIDKAMNLIMRYGTVFKFKSYGSGLFYYDIEGTDMQDSAKNKVTNNRYFLLSALTENR